MKKRFLTISLLLSSLIVVAQQKENENKDTTILKLNEVVVTAQRQQQQNLLVPFSVNSLGIKEMDDYQFRTTPEALMAMNGVFVQKTNHGGGSPFVRGVTGNQTLSLVDDIRLKINIADTTLGNVKIAPSALITNGALMYSISIQQTVYVSYSSGYRAPNVDDMGALGIVDFRYEVPAPDLKPERSRHTELGYKFQSKKISATVPAYYMHLSNIITRVKEEGQIISGYPVYKKEKQQLISQYSGNII